MYPYQQNRRRFRRVMIPPDAPLRCCGSGFRGAVRVLGEGGMLVDTIHPSPGGTELEVVIEVPEPIRARCISRDYEPGWGMGVEFVSLEHSERARIRELIARYV